MDEDNEGLFSRPVPRSLRRFGIAIGIYIILVIAGYVIANWGWLPQPDNLAPIGDVFLCGFGLVLWGSFFAQFVLPVNKMEGRLKIIEYLLIYIQGGHGPAVFIENGVVRAAEGELKKRGPGVIWLDSASAAVLRTPVKFTRVIGPGVHFTTTKEQIAATVDLHTLTQSIGPDENDDPWSLSVAPADEEDKKKKEALKKRCDATRALTRDNIEVFALITVNFRIRSKPGEGGSELGFDAENVRKAITESLLQGVATDQPVWSPLPAKMAADVWREYLRKFKLIELFEVTQGGNDTALKTIGDLLKKRLTQETIEHWDDYGRPPAPETPKIPSQEYARLQEMGLEVMSVTIKRLTFSPEVEGRLISQWTTQWLKNARKESEQVERNRKIAEVRAQEEALKDFALQASREISKSALDEDAKKTHALEMLVHSTFLGVRRNTLLLKRANAEQSALLDIFRWLREKRGETNNDIE